MSVNFGYGGYGMMNGMNMMGTMQGSQTGENVFREMDQKYNCNHCYQENAVPFRYQMYVNPLPYQVTHPSIFGRILRFFTGG